MNRRVIQIVCIVSVIAYVIWREYFSVPEENPMVKKLVPTALVTVIENNDPRCLAVLIPNQQALLPSGCLSEDQPSIKLKIGFELRRHEARNGLKVATGWCEDSEPCREELETVFGALSPELLDVLTNFLAWDGTWLATFDVLQGVKGKDFTLLTYERSSSGLPPGYEPFSIPKQNVIAGEMITF